MATTEDKHESADYSSCSMLTKLTLATKEDTIDPAFGRLKEKLTNCEHYFLSWLGDLKLEKDSLAGMISDPFLVVDPINDISETDSIGAGCKNSFEKEQANAERNPEVSNESYNNSSDNSEEIKTCVGKNWKCNFNVDGDEMNNENNIATELQKTVVMLIESFLHIQFEDVSFAKSQLLCCTNFFKLLVSQDSSYQDFFPGFDFLKVRLEANLKMKENLNDFVDHELFNFDDLSDKNKTFVYLAKWKFLELSEFRANRRQEAIEALEKVASCDRTNFTWHFVLWVRYRSLRRELHGPNSLPDEKEINASVASVEYSEPAGGLKYFMCKSGLCQTIAEVLSWRVSQPGFPSKPFNFGQLSFDSDEAVVKYIKKQAREALSRYPIFRFAEFTRYSEIFFSSLPYKYRNPEISIIFMIFSLKCRPLNSKANHMMGILFLLGDNDMEEAINYFRKAVKYEPSNYPAWMDLIQSLLQNPPDNQEELDKAFQTVSERTWPEKQYASLEFLRGCYYFMKGEKKDAIQTWISMSPSLQNKGDIRQTSFQNLFKVKTRYHWRPTSMQLGKVQSAIQELLQKTGVSDESNALKILKDEITTAMGNPRRPANTGPQHVFDTASIRQVPHGNCGSGKGDKNLPARSDYRKSRRPSSPDNWRN